MSSCPGPETIAALAEGHLHGAERMAVLAHVDGCRSCMEDLKDANAHIAEERSRRPWWIAIAAAAMIAAIFVTRPLWQRHTSPLERLVQLAPVEQRNVETRLTGGFAWAPYRGSNRATEEAANVERFKLVGETATLLERAQTEKSAAAQHAAGIALLLIDRPDEAIARLQAAAERAPSDAKIWSDLASAIYASALRFGRASLYPQALASADRALRADAKSAEALFNRALILERMGLTEEARAAWQRYLEVDGSSPWANEARDRLRRLPATTTSRRFSDEHERLRTADAKSTEAIVDRFRQHARAYAETELLGRWGETGNDDDLASARRIGDALVRLSGESLLRDAVASIDRAAPPQREALAAAHALYRQARLTYSRQRPAEAEPALRRAAQLFASAKSPMSLVARYYAANARVDQDDLATGRADLQALRAEIGAHPSYIALAAQVRWEIALCSMFEGDWQGVADSTAAAAEGFRRLGEMSNLAVMHAMQADALLYLGRPDDGWAAWIESFRTQSAEGLLDRLQVALGEAALVEEATGRTDSARAMLALAVHAARATRNDGLLSGTLVRESLLALKSGDRAEAVRAAREAMSIAERLPDPALRTRTIADAHLAMGAAEANPRQSVALLSRAIDHYEATAKDQFLPEARLLRARAAAAAGDFAAAQSDVDSALAQIETHRARVVGPVSGTGVFDAATDLYTEAMRLSLDRGDVAAAFAYAERSRGALALGETWHPIGARELQQRLRGSGIAVFEIVTRPDEWITFFIDERTLDVHRDASRSDDVYDRVVRPFEARLASARQLVVIADPSLRDQNFGALYDPAKKQHLFERLPVSTALSASSLDVAPGAIARSVVAVALPAQQAPDLPETEGELRDVGSAYANARLIEGADATVDSLVRAAPHADVLHIAGHTDRQGSAGDTALLFARGAGTAQRVSWKEAASLSIGRPVVVIAACESLRVAASPRAHAMSVGGGFLAAGATAVVGTLTPVADTEARALFRTIHLELVNGSPPAVAVQRAQRDALARGSPAWRAVTLLVTRVVTI